MWFVDFLYSLDRVCTSGGGDWQGADGTQPYHERMRGVPQIWGRVAGGSSHHGKLWRLLHQNAKKLHLISENTSTFRCVENTFIIWMKMTSLQQKLQQICFWLLRCAIGDVTSVCCFANSLATRRRRWWRRPSSSCRRQCASGSKPPIWRLSWKPRSASSGKPWST